MAQFEKRGTKETGFSYFARVRMAGVDEAKTFPTSAEAKAWAEQRQTELRDKKNGKIPDRPFSDLMREYALTESSKKDGERWEVIRIKMFLGDGKVKIPNPITLVSLRDLDSSDVATWRDGRSSQIKGESVRREWNLLSAICTWGVKEKKWLNENPFLVATKPDGGKPRNHIVSNDEIERIEYVSGYKRGVTQYMIHARTTAIWLFCIETGLRTGEACFLEWSDIKLNPDDIKKSVMMVTAIMKGGRKTGDPREVPLTLRAIEIIEEVRGLNEQYVFDLTPRQVDSHFRDSKKMAAMPKGVLTFRDSRATALTEMAEAGVEVLKLAKISGHRNLNMLLNTYYRKHEMSDVAEMLNNRQKPEAKPEKELPKKDVVNDLLMVLEKAKADPEFKMRLKELLGD